MTRSICARCNTYGAYSIGNLVDYTKTFADSDELRVQRPEEVSQDFLIQELDGRLQSRQA